MIRGASEDRSQRWRRAAPSRHKTTRDVTRDQCHGGGADVGGGEPSRGADVGGVSPVAVQMWAGVSTCWLIHTASNGSESWKKFPTTATGEVMLRSLSSTYRPQAAM